MEGFVINQNITLDIIQNNKNIKWDSTYICCNPNVTISDLKQMLFSRNIELNPNLTAVDIINDQDLDWNWQNLSFNLFDCHPAFEQIIIRV